MALSACRLQNSAIILLRSWHVCDGAGVREDRAAGGDGHPPQQQLPDLPPGAAGVVPLGHRGGLAGDHAGLHQQAGGKVRPKV